MNPTGVCPVCNGSLRRPAGITPYKSVLAGYDSSTDTLACNNCGGQTMFGQPQGRVPLRTDGTPCTHEYVGQNAGRSYTVYTCKHCAHKYDIDSGD